MKVVVLKTNLKQGLEVIGRVGGENTSNLPVLKNCLIETDNNRLKLSATNLELAATAFVSGKIIENGGLTVPFGTFNLIVSNLQTERINLEGGADYLIVKTDNYEARIQGIKKEEFPIIPKIQTDQITFTVEAGVFGEAASFAVSAAQITSNKLISECGWRLLIITTFFPFSGVLNLR